MKWNKQTMIAVGVFCVFVVVIAALALIGYSTGAWAPLE
jgi:hypothetical protein